MDWKFVARAPSHVRPRVKFNKQISITKVNIVTDDLKNRAHTKVLPKKFKHFTVKTTAGP